jgi:hypothetical protein
MNAVRLEELLSDLWAYVFAMFDREPGVTGDDAGKIATAAENAARQVTLTWLQPIGGRSVEEIAKGLWPHP